MTERQNPGPQPQLAVLWSMMFARRHDEDTRTCKPNGFLNKCKCSQGRYYKPTGQQMVSLWFFHVKHAMFV